MLPPPSPGLQLEDGTALGPLPLLLGGRSVEAVDGPTGGRCVVDGWPGTSVVHSF